MTTNKCKIEESLNPRLDQYNYIVINKNEHINTYRITNHKLFKKLNKIVKLLSEDKNFTAQKLIEDILKNDKFGTCIKIVDEPISREEV